MELDPASASAQRRAFVVLGGIFLALAPVAVYARLGTVVLLIVTLAAQPSLKSAMAALRSLSASPLVRIGALLAAWAAVSLLWAPAPNVVDLVRVAVVPVMGLLLITAINTLSAVETVRLARLVMVAGLVMLALLAIEVWSHGAVFRLIIPDPGPQPPDAKSWIVEVAARGAAVLAPTIFVFAFLIYTRASYTPNVRMACAVGFVAVGLTVCHSSTMDASWVAVAAGLVCFAVAVVAPRLALVGVFGGLMVYAVLAPVLSTYVLTLDGVTNLGDPEWVGTESRIGIWHEASRLIALKPLFGHGFDSARALSAQASTIPGTAWPALPLHPHNGFLQIWLELGGVGIAVMVALLAAAARALWPMTGRHLHLAISLATLTSTAVIALISFGIWQYWWLATWMFAAALLQVALRADLTQV